MHIVMLHADGCSQSVQHMSPEEDVLLGMIDIAATSQACSTQYDGSMMSSTQQLYNV